MITPRTSPIPRIDATALGHAGHPGHAEALAQARRAAVETGFMTVHDTAISPAFVRGVLAQYRQLFALPPEAKRRIDMARTGASRGWGASGSERVDPASNPDYKEVFDCGFELPADDPMADLRVYAPNLWPDGMPEFRDTIEAYYEAALGASMRILRAVAKAVEMPSDFFDDKFDRPMALLRGNWYPPRPTTAGPRDYGIAPHTDYGCLTLLATDGQPGLEVQGRAGSWIPVGAPPGEFVINFGEMLEMWTDGRVKATPHRVIGGAEERISVPLFFNPNCDANVAPVGSGRTILAGEHLSKRYGETYVHLAKTS